MEGGGDGRRRRNEADLADTLDAERRPGLGNLDELDLDLGDVLGPQDAELPQGRERRERRLRVGREVLAEGVAETHVHTSLDLPGAQLRVDRPPDVVDGDDPLDLGGVAVDDDELGRVAERRMNRRVGMLGVAELGGPIDDVLAVVVDVGLAAGVRAAAHACCTAPAAISVPREPVV